MCNGRYTLALKSRQQYSTAHSDDKWLLEII